MSFDETHTGLRTVEASPALPAPLKNKMKVTREVAPIASAELERITELAAKGCTEEGIRRLLGMARGEWRQRKKEDPELKDAIAAGRSLDLQECMNVLRQAA